MDEIIKHIEKVVEDSMAIIYDRLDTLENELVKRIPIYDYYNVPYEVSNFEAKMIIKRLVADYAELKELDATHVYKILYGRFAYKNKINLWLEKSKSNTEQSMLDFIVSLNEDAKYGLLICAYDLFDLTQKETSS